MKYYKNLIKRKKYGVLIFSLIFFLLGGSCFFYFVKDIIAIGIAKSGLSSYAIYNNGISGLIGSTNIGMILIGIMIMYIGIVYVPMNSPYAQDDSDYYIKSQGDDIYIRFKKNEFLVKKETFQPTDLFFRDKNKRFVSVTRGYQIYNYVKSNYKELTEKEVDRSKIILKSQVVDKFSNVKKMSNEEKDTFFKQIKLENKIRIFFVFTSVLLWVNFVFWSFGLLTFIITLDNEISSYVVSIIMIVISFILGRKSNTAMLKNKKMIKRILNGEMYIVECEIYDKKHDQTQDIDGPVQDNYYIKITDGNYIVDQWFEISDKKYNKENNNIVKIYVFDKTGNYYFLIY